MMVRFRELFVGTAIPGGVSLPLARFSTALMRRGLTHNEHLFNKALPTQLAGLYRPGQT